MVLENNRQLTEAMVELRRAREELAATKDFVAKVETKVVRTYKKNLPKAPEFAHLVTLFMEAGGDQVVHLEWDLSFLLAKGIPSTEAAAHAPPSSVEDAPSKIPSQALLCADPKKAAAQ
ncbi:hypothetical protein Fot_03501 [Forsythia ovata]|uniref:Uncharacterized protein n=1 Tax=Forsythia ovata TaxID=205694 RepID=A0ABD1X9W4_9LAMI